MNNDGKKIAFSFSKVRKPPLVNKVNVEPKEKIEYIDCFDGSKGKFSYKGNIRSDETPKIELVIPMPTTRTSTDIVKSRIEEKALRHSEPDGNNINAENKSGDIKDNQNKVQNIDELAAQEILNEIKNGGVDKKSGSKIVIETREIPQEASDTDIDYENVPVTDFGLALLRGMGWRPDLGIGKDPKLVEPTSPKLRPKGLGLGAKPDPEREKREEEKEKLKVSSSDKKNKKH